jgi:hypothetical protein
MPDLEIDGQTLLWRDMERLGAETGGRTCTGVRGTKLLWRHVGRPNLEIYGKTSSRNRWTDQLRRRMDRPALRTGGQTCRAGDRGGKHALETHEKMQS